MLKLVCRSPFNDTKIKNKKKAPDVTLAAITTQVTEKHIKCHLTWVQLSLHKHRKVQTTLIVWEDGQNY